MRPAAARPLRPGKGDSELAGLDIGRARPQLDVAADTWKRRKRALQSCRHIRTKKGLEQHGTHFFEPSSSFSRPIVHGCSSSVSSVLPLSPFLNYYHLYHYY